VLVAPLLKSGERDCKVFYRRGEVITPPCPGSGFLVGPLRQDPTIDETFEPIRQHSWCDTESVLEVGESIDAGH
jgi:hypothetical protein